jgi:hypothetical protein
MVPPVQPPQIQNEPFVKKLTFRFASVRYVALPSGSGPPEHPRGQAASARSQRGGAVAFQLMEMAEPSLEKRK